MRSLIRSLAVCPFAAPAAVPEINGARFDLPFGRTLAARDALSTCRRDFGGGSSALMLVAGPSSDTLSNFDRNFEAVARATGAEGARDPVVEDRGTTTNGHVLRHEIACCLERQGASLDKTTSASGRSACTQGRIGGRP